MRRVPVRWNLVLLIGMTVTVAAILIPPLTALGNAWAAKRGIEQSVEALAAADLAAATSHAAKAREDAEDLGTTTRGLSGLLWEPLPGARNDKEDIRHLSAALGQAAAAVTTIVDAYPEDRADGGFLLGGHDQVDLAALEAVLGELEVVEQHVHSAIDSLDRVEGSSTLLGPLLRSGAQSAEDRLIPVREGLILARPLIPVLPRLLGRDGKQEFLIALLNPAEQRYSGGASLSFMTLSLDDGRLSQGETVTGTDEDVPFKRISWKPVRDNPFHRPGQVLRLSTASLAPSWSVSGEELLRAWEEVQAATAMEGLVAVDVMALQDLMRFTGAIDVPGYGSVNASNLAKKLIGSYDEYTGPEVFAARRVGSGMLLSEFQDRMLSASGLFGKISSLVSSAEARHLAVYHRDPQISEALREMGVAGDLSSTPHDYVGIFNQALVGLKSDYWQRRRVSHDVTLRERGGARVRLEVEIHNDSPPPATGVDPQYSAYVRRDNEMSLAAFLPEGSRGLSVKVDDSPVRFQKRSFRDRPFVPITLKLEPQEVRSVTLTYDVPRASIVRPRGLEYHLDVDPQGLVHPSSFDVSVRWPDGYRPMHLPEGWTAEERSATFSTEDLTFSPRWRIDLARDSASPGGRAVPSACASAATMSGPQSKKGTTTRGRTPEKYASRHVGCESRPLPAGRQSLVPWIGMAGACTGVRSGTSVGSDVDAGVRGMGLCTGRWHLQRFCRGSAARDRDHRLLTVGSGCLGGHARNWCQGLGNCHRIPES